MPDTGPLTFLYCLFDYQKYHHFRAEVTEAQRNQLICQKSQLGSCRAIIWKLEMKLFTTAVEDTRKKANNWRKEVPEKVREGGLQGASRGIGLRNKRR